MRAYHNSRDDRYRSPYGALELGKQVKLSLDVFDGEGAECLCRLWVDGVGERLIPMEGTAVEDGVRYTCAFVPERPALVWYSFILRREGREWRYGAREGSVGGEGRLYDWEP
ncbi:MAG: hypothetical protein J6J81_04860, partial [Oscillospiraceae bacterium]|nr:hypothetical protein [Oscillospiraceae bacterium]